MKLFELPIYSTKLTYHTLCGIFKLLPRSHKNILKRKYVPKVQSGSQQFNLKSMNYASQRGCKNSIKTNENGNQTTFDVFNPWEWYGQIATVYGRPT